MIVTAAHPGFQKVYVRKKKQSVRYNYTQNVNKTKSASIVQQKCFTARRIALEALYSDVGVSEADVQQVLQFSHQYSTFTPLLICQVWK